MVFGLEVNYLLISAFLVFGAGASKPPELITGVMFQANSQQPAARADGKPESDAASALDFLGSYSAPQAVLATETGHTSSRPPSVDAGRRLDDLSRDLGQAPLDPVNARRTIVETLGSGPHPPDLWFRIGTLALAAARADSRRLAETAPSSDWNRRLEAEALAGRYPLIARSLWPSYSQAATPSPNRQNTDRTNSAPGAESSSSSPDLARWRDQLSAVEDATETPEVLYRRARILVGISGVTFKLASASPTYDARLYALQALAAEEENDEGAALEEYRAGLAKYPESGLLHAGLGHLYRERNELDLSRVELEKAYRVLPVDAPVAFDLGDVDLRMGDAAHALALLDRALELDPNLLVARWSRGRAYLALGGDENRLRALEDLEASVQCDTSGALQGQLSQLYAKLGRAEDARRAEQKSTEQRRATEQAKHGAELP